MQRVERTRPSPQRTYSLYSHRKYNIQSGGVKRDYLSAVSSILSRIELAHRSITSTQYLLCKHRWVYKWNMLIKQTLVACMECWQQPFCVHCHKWQQCKRPTSGLEEVRLTDVEQGEGGGHKDVSGMAESKEEGGSGVGSAILPCTDILTPSVSLSVSVAYLERTPAKQQAQVDPRSSMMSKSSLTITPFQLPPVDAACAPLAQLHWYLQEVFGQGGAVYLDDYGRFPSLSLSLSAIYVSCCWSDLHIRC